MDLSLESIMSTHNYSNTSLRGVAFVYDEVQRHQQEYQEPSEDRAQSGPSAAAYDAECSETYSRYTPMTPGNS